MLPEKACPPYGYAKNGQRQAVPAANPRISSSLLWIAGSPYAADAGPVTPLPPFAVKKCELPLCLKQIYF